MNTSGVQGAGSLPSRGLLIALLVTVTVLSLGAAIAFDRSAAHTSLFDLANLVGPTTQSLLHGQGLTVCTIAMGTPGNPICYHAGRMPVPSLVVALGVRLFGDRLLQVAIFKTALLLMPIALSIVLVWRRLSASWPRQIAAALLLGVPFVMTPFLADVVNLQVEEGYAYSLLALALAILFFGPSERRGNRLDHWGYVVLFALMVDGLYLSKSSMAPATGVLTLAFLLQQRRMATRILLLALVAAAPIGWAMHQHHASGRYSLGTSVDGINLHKANVATFLQHYPPAAGSSLDQYDSDLNRGLSFPDEWSFNDYHQHEAIQYLRAHPGATLRGDLRKLDVLFVTFRRYGSSESHGLQLLAETVGIVLFRLILWVAIAFAVYGLLRRSSTEWRSSGAAFLALLAACALPYVVGFAYTRHASVLIYPACLMCCRVLTGKEPRSKKK